MRKLLITLALAIVALAAAVPAVSAKVPPLSQLHGCFAGPAGPKGGCAYTGATNVSLLLDERETGNGSTQVPIVGLSTFALPCVGMHNNQPDYLQLKHGLSIDRKTDRFSYRGKVYNPWDFIPGAPSVYSPITLSGQFTSRTTATLTLTVHYKSCGTQHFRLRTPERTTL